MSTDPRPASYGFCSRKGVRIRGETSTATPRRSGLDLGPSLRAVLRPPPPYLTWAASLQSSPDDRDGIDLYALPDSWFARSGFRRLEPWDSVRGRG